MSGAPLKIVVSTQSCCAHSSPITTYAFQLLPKVICRCQRLILFRTEGFEQERTEGTEQKSYNIKNPFPWQLSFNLAGLCY